MYTLLWAEWAIMGGEDEIGGFSQVVDLNGLSSCMLLSYDNSLVDLDVNRYVFLAAQLLFLA